MRTIKLMPDYHCFPLWEASPGQVGNIDPKCLQISGDLKMQLEIWAETFDATLNMDDPAYSGFQSAEAEAEFKENGSELGRRLQDELGPNFTVKIKI